MNKPTRIKRLYFDIETSPNIGYFWQAGYKLNIPTDNIIKERAIITICYKWEGQKDVYSLTWDKTQNDKGMLEKFVKVANEADELVGHNGDRFDLPWVRTRCLYHRIPMMPDYKSIDTLKVSRSKFRFNSNRLNYIAKYLNIGQKIHTSFDLWTKIVFNKDKQAMDKMVRYCKQDVRLLERVYKELEYYFNPKTHVGVLNNKPKSSCPRCGNDEYAIHQTIVSATGVKKYNVKCKGCHSYHTVKA
jgi:DNA polymerase elongation subunit (family B)